ncbi:MAG: aconitase family protein [Acidobacteriota bacterium]
MSAGRRDSPAAPIRPARLKPGASSATSAARRAAPPAGDGRRRVVRGRALILWDPERPGRKRDAVDTDQITPASDCVSESLERLDERWKAGAFRHLMPDFRSRVHRGETFLIAGDRFAIGSSREMSPAGLRGVAEDAGLEMVVVCGADMGDIFRRNALNLGLHVVQCPEAVEEARDGDEFSFDVATRGLANVTRGRTYEPLPLTAKEEEIRRSGGIIAVGRREFVESVRAVPRVIFPDPRRARRMTLTEQIVSAHRVDRDADVRPGATLRVWADLLPASDGTAPFAIHTFNQITGGRAIDPRQAAIVSDHFVFTGREADQRQTAISREFARLHGIEPPHYAAPGTGIFHFYLPEQGLILPGGLYPGGDSHSRAYGAYGAVGIGVGSTTVGFGWATGYVYLSLARQRRVTFTGRLQPWVVGKDVVLELLRRWGGAQAEGMGVEFVDPGQQLPMTYRNTIANMMAEAEAQNGIFARDAITEAWYAGRGIACPYPRIVSGPEARFEKDEVLDLSLVVPMIARPFSPGNAHPAEEVARERLTFDKALIGSCTNGSYEDLLAAALVIDAARRAGHPRVARGVRLVVFPGSGSVARRIETPEPRLSGEPIASVFRSAGGVIRESWCGPCFGQGDDALRRGERAITTFNRNWQNRMGVGGEGYLASPPVVAASAIAGYMAPPSEIGLTWSPAEFGV